MARTVLPIAGAIIGAFYGNPYAGYAIGAAIAGVVDPINTKGPRIGETGAQTSQEGAPRAIVFGTCQVTGNVIASGPLIKRDVKESQGKGGGSVSTEHAYRTFAVRICEGPVAGFLRVWQDDKLVYDIRPSSTMLEESEKWKANKNFYLGDEAQLPDTSLQMIFGVDETPAHRGSAYMVAIEDDLTDRRGSIPQYRFEVATTVSNASWPGYTWTPVQNTTWSSSTPCIATTQGMTVATGNGSSTPSWASVDLVEWQAAPLDNGGSYIAAGGGVFVLLVGGNNSFAFVGNGLGWEDVPTPVSSARAGIAYGNGTFLIIGSNSGLTVAHLGGPGGWTTIEPGLNVTGKVRFGNGVFVTLQPNKVNASADGSAWVTYTTPFVAPADLVWSPELALWLLIGGSGSGRVATSPNLATWTVRATPNNTFLSGAWSPELGLFAVVGNTSFISSPDGIVWTAHNTLPSGGYEDIVWVPERGRFVIAAIGPSRILVSDSFPGTIGGLPVPLGEIVTDIHARCDFPAGKFDVTELTDMVSGLVLAGEYTGADAINTLRSLYLFDAADQDKVIVYPKRGKPVVATITEDDIVEAEESSRREQAIEYPKKLHLSYQNAVGGYAVAKATSARSSPDVRVVGEVATSVPVVLSPDQAARTAAIMHKIAWAEAEGETTLSVPLSWIKYIASDCFGVALRGRVTRERLDELNTADGLIEYTMRRDRQSAYTSSVTGIPIAEPTPPPSTIVGETVLAAIDISGRVDSEDDLNILYAVSGGLPAWNGATVQRSFDGGANFSSVVDIGRGIAMGTLLDAVADAAEDFTDLTNVVRVQLYRDSIELESISETEFLSEGGALVVMRPDGSSEVMQCRDADEVSPGVYDLRVLHRGLLNSGTSSHLAGALVVGLSRAVHATAQSTWIGQAITHRAVSYGESPETADEQTQIYVGRSQIEWPVDWLQLTRTGSTVAATWTPRHRFGSDVVPVESVNFRGYRVTLDDGVLPIVTFDTTAPSFTYDASALGSPITVTVSALNRITGAGPSTSGTV